jgi:hypothetical protein
MFFRLRGGQGGGAHLFQSCLHATKNGLLLATKEMHLFF